MIQTVLNWLKFDVQNFIVEVWWISLVLWCGLLVMGILSIATNTLTPAAKAAWIGVIVLVPLAGLFVYCLFCLTRVDYHMLEFLFRRPKSSRRKIAGPSAPPSQTLP